jgi:hypothetical protein
MLALFNKWAFSVLWWAMKLFAGVTTLTKQLTLTALDQLYLQQFNEAGHDKKVDLIKKAHTSHIVRLAHNNKDFASYCERLELQDCWKQRWCIFGALLIEQKEPLSSLFYAQPKSNNFKLIQGAYFFYRSQQVLNSCKTEFSFSEIEYLKIAIKFGSVHAVQRYNNYLYSKLSSEAIEDKDVLFEEIIANSKSMLSTYGSYAYMMLGEALGRYALWLREQNRTAEAKKNYLSAMQSLGFAEKILVHSQYSIHNASLGVGLKKSNTLSIGSPSEAEDKLKTAFNSSLGSSPLRA